MPTTSFDSASGSYNHSIQINRLKNRHLMTLSDGHILPDTKIEGPYGSRISSFAVRDTKDALSIRARDSIEDLASMVPRSPRGSNRMTEESSYNLRPSNKISLSPPPGFAGNVEGSPETELISNAWSSHAPSAAVLNRKVYQMSSPWWECRTENDWGKQNLASRSDEVDQDIKVNDERMAKLL